MLKAMSFSKSETATNVLPSNNIFKELGNNTYDLKDLLSELIDNSIAQRVQGKQLDVSIEIFWDNQIPTEFIINDTAKGIAREDFGICITPAGKQTSNGLNEHGLGMKQAVAALGELNYLASKTMNESIGTAVKEFSFGNIETFDVSDFPYPHGTIISVTNINKIMHVSNTYITNNIVKYLGARYRKYLCEGNKLLNLSIKFLKYGTQDVINEWSISEVKQIYFHPSTRTNQPVIQNFPIEGANWSAELTFGYAPANIDEYKELQIDPVNRFHPYNVSLAKQGLDIILHDRVILFNQLSELSIIPSRHNDYNVMRGEINLINGFRTAITKNSMISDYNFSECINKVTKILNGEAVGPNNKQKNYLRLKSLPTELPEKLLRDRLRDYLIDNPFIICKHVNTEYVIEGIEGYVDILADDTAYEIKTQQASALDVYQLFMYMDIGKISNGYLVAKSFSTGAKIAVERVNDKYEMKIELSILDKFPINHMPSNEERDKYY